MKSNGYQFPRLFSATLAVFILTVIFHAALFAQTSVFTYQGRLTDGAAAASGIYDLEFKLYDAGGTQIGATQLKEDVSVSNGTFTVSLDFGAAAFDGAERILEISIRRGAETGAFTALAPRQPVTSTPYAIRALSAANADGAANFSGNLAGDVTGTQNSTVISSVGGQTANSVASGAAAANQASSTNTPDKIVKRDTNGNFSAGTITATLNGNASTATSADSVAGAAGNSIVNAINNSATTTTINVDRLSSNVVRFNPPTAQVVNAESSNDAMLNFSSSINGQIFRFNHSGSFFARGDDFVGSIPFEGVGTRMMWYAGKGAFRAGRTNGTQWNDSNIGMYSTAFGFNSRASGDNTFVAGPGSVATQGSAVAIGESNTANAYSSYALGYRANTNAKPGSFVFGDFSTPDFIVSTANNQATFRVSGGFRIFTNANLLSGVYIPANGSAWEVISDRNSKENFQAVNPRDILRKVLSLPISTWNYKVQDASIRHIGAMAQDFKAAFSVGESDKSISTIDPDGVALAAIQGLNEELKEQTEKLKAENNVLKAQFEQQQRQINELKKIVCAMKADAEICK